ncbi:hypothetical protein [Limisalsivibrio acetivorans]|uniref:hypothetical protein n=1 Tax=Limisalsivibrio acetivorans TaxID=1304888 RepID=UPI0003B78A1B|nr:hypothetical protein [Limisalsivibrio acetivorans]
MKKLFCIVITLAVAVSVYASDFTRFFPYLIDIEGWMAADAQGGVIELPEGERIVTASRDYMKRSSRLRVMVMDGSAAVWKAVQEDGADNVTSVGTIEGFSVYKTINPSAKAGYIVVPLMRNYSGGGVSRIATFEFSGLGEGEAEDTASMFDWQGMADNVSF